MLPCWSCYYIFTISRKTTFLPQCPIKILNILSIYIKLLFAKGTLRIDISGVQSVWKVHLLVVQKKNTQFALKREKIAHPQNHYFVGNTSYKHDVFLWFHQIPSTLKLRLNHFLQLNLSTNWCVNHYSFELTILRDEYQAK